jgi:membrane protein DedA with SNARE-associated domain
MSFETLHELIAEYGYWAVLVGTFLEGESILVLGGLVAQMGLLELRYVILAAFVGSATGDQLLYFLGRYWGTRILERFPRIKPRLEPALRLLHRHQVPFILGFRFIYGVRAVSAFAIGMAGVRPRVFVWLNLIAASIWAVCFGGAGYLFGEALEAFLGRLQKYQSYILLGAAGVAMLVWLAHHLRQKRRARRAADPGATPRP